MLSELAKKSEQLPSRESALPGRATKMQFDSAHFVSGNPIVEPVPAGLGKVVFGMGCFWGAERKFWQLNGVFSTAAGYSGGITPNPAYEEVCSGMTGHTEVVLVFYDPGKISFEKLLKTFWESHDPTQGMRQGNDRGTQYRSALFCGTDEQLAVAKRSCEYYQAALDARSSGKITTEISMLYAFYYAENYHQQYLAKNPLGYCGMSGTGVTYNQC
jgi:peptide-methionine (S)-S-oxide reductase